MRKVILAFIFVLTCCHFSMANPSELASEYYINDANIELSINSGSEVRLNDDLLDSSNLFFRTENISNISNEIKNEMNNKISNKKIASVLAFLFGNTKAHHVYLGTTTGSILSYCSSCYSLGGIAPAFDFFMVLVERTDKLKKSKNYFSR